MEVLLQISLAFGVVAAHLAGNWAEALSYDYSASIECLDKPLKPQYGGGIIANPEFDDGLDWWSTFGGGKVEHRGAMEGNSFVVSHSRKQPYHSVSQKLYLRREKLYTLAAWVRVDKGNAQVTAVFKTVSGFVHAGTAAARSGCWSMLKGGIAVPDASGPAELYFETQSTDVEIWIDSVSVQPFSREEWRSQQEESVENVRKRTVRLRAVDSDGNPLRGASISVKGTRSGFPFGCAINQNILHNSAYQNWFTSRGFSLTTFEDEMKWYTVESAQGHEDYSLPDALLAFAKQHGVAVRGHNIFWDDPTYQQPWIKSLSADQLRAAADKHAASLLSRYKGQVVAWDVVNENLHFDFFERALGPGASGEFYRMAQQLDPATPLFLNDYNTIEEPSDPTSSPANYLQKAKDMMGRLAGGAQVSIGLEGHFHTPNLPYIRSSLDTLAASNLPIWITELDVASGSDQAAKLEAVLNEVHSHPGVKGVVIWAAWRPSGCYRMCLTDNNFKNLPTGDVVDKIMGAWRASADKNGTTDGSGYFEARLPHGDYDVTVSHPSLNTSSLVRRSFNVNDVSGSVIEAGLLHVEIQI